MAWNGDGTHLASGAGDETIKIWDTESGECVKTLKGSREVGAVAWNGKLLAAAAYNKIHMFNVGA